jgi:hypothetical protein
MANFHLSAKTGSRSGGKSAGAKSDYINREKKYRRMDDELVRSESGNMPEWVNGNPREYWGAADTFERANGRLYKEVEFSLMREIPLSSQLREIRSFVEECTQGEKLPYTLAIHKGRGMNPHCHLMISERVNDGIPRSKDLWFKRYNRKTPENGGARKSEALKPKGWLQSIREKWEFRCNKMLEREGLSERVSCKSLADQGIGREPQIHLGPNVKAMKAKGIETERGALFREIGIKNREIEVLERTLQEVSDEIATTSHGRSLSKRALEDGGNHSQERLSDAPDRDFRGKAYPRGHESAQFSSGSDREGEARKAQIFSDEEMRVLGRMSSSDLSGFIERIRPPLVSLLVEREPEVKMLEGDLKQIQTQKEWAETSRLSAEYEADLWRQEHPVRAKMHDSGFKKSEYLIKRADTQADEARSLKELEGRYNETQTKLEEVRSDHESRLTEMQAPSRRRVEIMESILRQKLATERAERALVKSVVFAAKLYRQGKLDASDPGVKRELDVVNRSGSSDQQRAARLQQAVASNPQKNQTLSNFVETLAPQLQKHREHSGLSR